MISDHLPPVRFSVDDMPQLDEIPGFNLESCLAAERQRKEETVRWLEDHCPWQPIGDVW